MKILVINLERSRERREFMRTQLDSLGLNYEFFLAVDASLGELEGRSRYDEDLAMRKMGHPLRAGEVGCWASHYGVWQRCVTLGTPVLVMEDDVALAPGFPAAVALASERIAERHFIRLFGIWDSPCRICESLADGHSLVRFLKGPVGAQCYVVSPTGAATLLKHADVWIDAVDKYIDAFWIHGLASFAIKPFHLTHNHEGGPPSVIDETRTRYRRPLVSVLRRKATHIGYRIRRIVFNLRQR